MTSVRSKKYVFVCVRKTPKRKLSKIYYILNELSRVKVVKYECQHVKLKDAKLLKSKHLL